MTITGWGGPPKLYPFKTEARSASTRLKPLGAGAAGAGQGKRGVPPGQPKESPVRTSARKALRKKWLKFHINPIIPIVSIFFSIIPVYPLYKPYNPYSFHSSMKAEGCKRGGMTGSG